MKIILHEIKNDDSNININNNNNDTFNNNTVNNKVENTTTENTTTENTNIPTSKEEATKINKEAFDRFIDSIFNPFDYLVDYSNKKNIHENDVSKNTDTFKIKSDCKIKQTNDKKINNGCSTTKDINGNSNLNINPFVNPSDRGYTQKYNVAKTPLITQYNYSISTENSTENNFENKIENKSVDINSSNNNNVDVNSVYSFLIDISRVYYNIEDCNKIIQKWKKADLNELNHICGLRSCNNGKYLTIDGINVATPDEIRNKYAENTISTHLMDYSDNYFQMVCSRMEKLLYALWMCKQKAEFYNNKLHQ